MESRDPDLSEDALSRSRCALCAAPVEPRARRGEWHEIAVCGLCALALEGAEPWRGRRARPC